MKQSYLIPVFMSSLVYSLSFINSVASQSIIPQNNSTNTLVNSQGNQYNITGGKLSQDQTNLFHDFQQFNLNSNEIANFIGTSQLQNILSYISSGNPSFINGLIQVTQTSANLYLINPAGIVFGNDASLNVPADFIATTASQIGFENGQWLNVLSNNNYYENFLGYPQLFSFNLSNNGGIINGGNLTVSPQSSVYLIAGEVVNTGTITAESGKINLIAIQGTKTLKLSPEGSILSLEINATTPFNSLNPLDLPTLLTGTSINTGLTVNSDYRVQSDKTGIIIPNEQGVNITTGVINTSGIYGGEIAIIGNKVGLFSATISANGTTGTVLIGGNYQGKGSIPTSDYTIFDRHSSITANALGGGNAGKVILWGNEATYFQGKISAIGGQGGFVETSGKNYLLSTGVVETQGGTWLLDPYDITIQAGADTNVSSTPNFTSNNSPAIVTPISIKTALDAGTNVVITTGTGGTELGNITIIDPISADVPIGSTVSLTLNATNHILVQNTIIASNICGALDVLLNADSDGSGDGHVFIDFLGNIETNGGNIVLNGNSTVDYGIFARSNYLLSNGGLITLNSINSYIDTQNTTLKSASAFEGGIVQLTTNGGDILTGNIYANSTGSASGGDIILTVNGGTGKIDTTGASGTSILSTLSKNGPGGKVQLTTTDGNITVYQIDTQSSPGCSAVSTDVGGDIILQVLGTNGSIQALTGGILTTNANDGNGGNITLQTGGGNINTASISTNSFAVGGKGGDVKILITGGSGTIDVTAGSGINTTSTNFQGGNITLSTVGGKIFSNALVSNVNNFSGKAGDISLSAKGDIEVESIQAENLDTGSGGNVSVTTEGFLRVLSSFTAEDGLLASISTIGVSGGGNIVITHGGNGVTPFIVGDATVNGTAERITSGLSTITTLQSFLGNTTVGNIQILTGSQTVIPSTLPLTSPTNNASNQTTDDTIEKDFQDQDNLPPLKDQEQFTQDDRLIREVEDYFTSLYTAYFNLPQQTDLGLSDIQDKLEEIEQKTKEKPALIYAFFQPKSNKQNRNKQNLTKSEMDNIQNTLWRYNQTENSILIPPKGQEKDDDQLVLLLVTSRGNIVRHYLENYSRKEILRIADQFRSKVTNTRSNLSYLPYAQALYNVLIQPLKEDIDSHKLTHLTFILDNGLRGLPLAAFHDGKQFLIEKYSIGLMPSFSLTDTRYATLNNASVLAMGADRFPTLNPLPAVPLELKLITEKLATGEYFLNEQFTIDNLNQARNNYPYPIVHLATHGTFVTGKPSNSLIYFWNNPLALDQLNMLQLNSPKVELLVLSACQTALGDTNAELGFSGLAVSAGVKSAMGSLWSVSDEGTLALMTQFYSHLKTSSTKSLALRNAQIALLRGDIQVVNGELVTRGTATTIPLQLSSLNTTDLVHPYYWSAFMIVGSPW